MLERGPGGEARSPPPTPLSFPHPPPICPPDGDWQMQDLPGAPGTARQGRTRIIVLTNDGGNATQPRAPGHERPLAAKRAARHGRLSAAPTATVPSPAGPRRLRQECLPRVPANPRTLTYMHARQDTAHTRTVYRRATRYVQSRESRNPPLSTWWRGAGGEGRHPSPLSSGRPLTIHQVHPAFQIPPHPRSCSTACTGFSRQRHSRAPPMLTRRKPTLVGLPPSPHGGEGPGVRHAPRLPPLHADGRARTGRLL